MYLPASIVLLVPLLSIAHCTNEPDVERKKPSLLPSTPSKPTVNGKQSPVVQPTQVAGKNYKITEFVYLDIKIGGENSERIKIGLFGDVVPKTVANFIAFANGYEGKQYGNNDPFHRIIPDFMMQGGDVVSKNGVGRTSIYGGKFNDENFELKHAGPGYVSMANGGPNTNGCQFFITFIATPWLDGKHVVFGKVIDGMDTVRKAEAEGSRSGRTRKPVLMTASGSLDPPNPPMFLQNDKEGTVVTNQ